MDKTVLVEQIKVPDGMSFKTHFFVVNKDMQVIAVKRNLDMLKKSSETRKKNAVLQSKRLAKKVDKRVERLAKEERLQAMRNIDEEIKRLKSEKKEIYYENRQ